MNVQTASPRAKVRKLARERTISTLNNLEDLMRAIERRESKATSRLISMLRALAGHISMYFDKPPSEIAISQLADLRSKLRPYLVERGLKENSVRSYINYLRILLIHAEELGWREKSLGIEKEWDATRAAVASVNGARGIVRYAVDIGKAPVDFGDDDLNQWGDERLRGGQALEYVQHLKSVFRRRVAETGLDKLMPKISIKVHERWTIPLEQFPDPLRTQVLDVLAWKTARFVTGRPIRTRHRPVTARHLQWLLESLYGFVYKIRGKKISSLSEFRTDENVSAYTEWCVNERRLRATTLGVWVGMIGALGRYPLFGGKTFAWARNLAAGLPPDVNNRTQQVKAQKWVDYDVLWQVPERIRDDASRTTSARKKAELIGSALLLQWLLVAPWRQRNLRECRIRPSRLGGNLFFEEISRGS